MFATPVAKSTFVHYILYKLLPPFISYMRHLFVVCRACWLHLAAVAAEATGPDHSAHKKAANLATLKGDSPHEAQAAQEDSAVPDSPAGSQDVDGDEGDQDPEY
ncbi:hypothetical protein ABBQ32_010992 [Trebouxia sp. C0010 RCD-2024]